MEQHLAVMMFAPRMGALLFAVFGGLGLILAAVGVWGTVSYAVARRTKEVGIRMALGSTAREAVALMTSSGARLVAFGAAAGIALALVASRFLAGFLFGIDAMDPLTFLAVPALLASVGVLAAWLPARRVAAIDPMRALRQD
jgi:ABC-type antimicrobial peptide transport system permease subunit